MKPLPILISVPHGGNETPKEIADRVCITPKDLFEDSDAFTKEIYGIKNEVAAWLGADIARVFIDLNRAENDLPPNNPDGVVKSLTCHGQPIYSNGWALKAENIKTLLQKYYQPYHKKLQTLIKNHIDIRLALDCHSMEPTGPKIAPDSGKDRPLLCLSNVNGKSAPDEWMQCLAQCFRESFGLQEGDIAINKPFVGGYITRSYGNHPIPWIQVEMNRKLYLSEPWFNKSSLTVDAPRLKRLREQFKQGLDKFCHVTFAEDRHI
ncbi:MAG: N-formylglutamate amidohydrolase [Nitrosomonas sp.]|nr:N-formylglutamate amidohydrolase [Nitrosomonas sp.]